MKKVVISLGGSVIVPDNVDIKYLDSFKKFINKISKGNKIIIITGGGKTARNYIKPLEHEKLDMKSRSLIGIMATRINARLLASIFNIKEIPEKMTDLKILFKKKSLIICGALDFHPGMTSDGTAADVAKAIKADLLINITNVDGLYNKDPRNFKNAKFISNISFKEFFGMARKIKFKAGQHFVLDSMAANIIMKNKIKTLIVNKNIGNLNKIFLAKSFKGSVISD